MILIDKRTETPLKSTNTNRGKNNNLFNASLITKQQIKMSNSKIDLTRKFAIVLTFPTIKLPKMENLRERFAG